MARDAPDPVLLMTRPRAEAERFAQDLGLRGVRTVIAPLLELAARAEPADPGGVPVFTSAAAVPFAGPGRGRRAWCVGPRTAAAAQDGGWRVSRGGGDGAALLEAIRASGDPGPFVHLRGAEARVALAEGLRAAGLPARERIVYEQRARPLTEEARGVLGGRAPVVAPLFSPRTARLFSEGAGEVAAPLAVLALSAAVAAEAARFAPLVAARPDGAAMAEATRAALRAAAGGEP